MSSPRVADSIAADRGSNFEGCQSLTIQKQKLLSIYNNHVTCPSKQDHVRLLCFFVKSIANFAEV
ncbi:hypothetical protein C3387_16540 [Leclercia sp. LSNIH6]|nr:hypothetical protein C3370_18535 [Leclercia sp. LSNIH7]POU75894.1 hypothetical protein C3387_16540 [Leclercia sp. LSNIH6]POW49399.1 hypothetical protein C3406_19805 [Leclercia sp. LSNIH8]